ncbi:CDP-glucose 4,6-dehydratase [Methylophaga thalassica]|uniref:CDP-glucose 4,6-dehydratase n=1 Tax=Methylophaga aminisulfidivorans TaxID=230105 RepID=UPI0024E1C28D|nr:CDP-glucose 4,6-dehydratase [Methylophaga aminisulfidivorans]
MESLVIDPSFWQGKSVLVTGHTGFKGSWLSLWLNELGANVTGYALAPATNPSMYDSLALDDELDSIVADISDLATLAVTIKTSQPDIVFHLAAQSLVKPSYDDPVNTYQTNVMGTVNVLEAVRHCPSVKAVVIVTSDKCYENYEWSWPYRENDRLGGHDPYSNSKGCAELVTDSYRKSFFADNKTAIATARAGNVIGGGDWSDYRLLPDLIKAKQNTQPLEIRHPAAIRPWQHVLEPLSGYLQLAQQLCESGVDVAEAWNFGPVQEDIKPVHYLVEQAQKKWSSFEWYSPSQNEHHEANILMLDCSKARQKLGWQPVWRIDDALSKTFDWYDAFYSGKEMREFSLQQIQQFVQAANPQLFKA